MEGEWNVRVASATTTNASFTVREYFAHTLYASAKHFDRSFALSVFLLFFKHASFLAMLLILEIARYASWEDDSRFACLEQLVKVTLTINSAVAGVILINLPFYKNAIVSSIARVLIAPVFAVYNYGLFSIALYSSLTVASAITDDLALCCSNIALTLLIGLASAQLDYDFRWGNQDKLAMSGTKMRKVWLIFDLGLLVLQQILDTSSSLGEENKNLKVISSIAFVFIALLSSSVLTYYDKRILLLDIAFRLGSAIILISPLIMPVYKYQSVIKQSIAWLLPIIGAPIALKIAELLVNSQYETIHANIHAFTAGILPAKSLELKQLDFFLRHLVGETKTDYDEFVNAHTSLSIEAFRIFHKRNCDASNINCYCQKASVYGASTDSKSHGIADDRMLLKEMIDIVASMYKNLLGRAFSSEFHYGYIYFVIDVQKNISLATYLAYSIRECTSYTPSWVEAQRSSFFTNKYLPSRVHEYMLSTEDSQTLPHQRFIKPEDQTQENNNTSIVSEAGSGGGSSENKELNEGKSKGITGQVKKSTNNRPKVPYMKKSMLMKGILTEEAENRANIELLECLSGKMILLKMLQQNERIHLVAMYAHLIELKKAITKLQNEVIKLISINPSSFFVLQIIETIESSLCCNNRLSTQLKWYLQRASARRRRLKRAIGDVDDFDDLNDGLFSDEFCTIFLSFNTNSCYGGSGLSNTNGSNINSNAAGNSSSSNSTGNFIRKASRNYVRILRWDVNKKQGNLIGQKIDSILPAQIANVHDAMMSEYFKREIEKSTADTIHAYDDRDFLGVDGYGWAAAYHIQFQITFLFAREVGFCARISLDRTVKEAIVFNAKRFEIWAVSENLYDAIFAQIAKKTELHTIKVDSHILGIQQFLNGINKQSTRNQRGVHSNTEEGNGDRKSKTKNVFNSKKQLQKMHSDIPKNKQKILFETVIISPLANESSLKVRPSEIFQYAETPEAAATGQSTAAASQTQLLLSQYQHVLHRCHFFALTAECEVVSNKYVHFVNMRISSFSHISEDETIVDALKFVYTKHIKVATKRKTQFIARNTITPSTTTATTIAQALNCVPPAANNNTIRIPLQQQQPNYDEINGERNNGSPTASILQHFRAKSNSNFSQAPMLQDPSMPITERKEEDIIRMNQNLTEVVSFSHKLDEKQPFYYQQQQQLSYQGLLSPLAQRFDASQTGINGSPSPSMRVRYTHFDEGQVISPKQTPHALSSSQQQIHLDMPNAGSQQMISTQQQLSSSTQLCQQASGVFGNEDQRDEQILNTTTQVQNLAAFTSRTSEKRNSSFLQFHQPHQQQQQQYYNQTNPFHNTSLLRSSHVAVAGFGMENIETMTAAQTQNYMSALHIHGQNGEQELSNVKIPPKFKETPNNFLSSKAQLAANQEAGVRVRKLKRKQSDSIIPMSEQCFDQQQQKGDSSGISQNAIQVLMQESEARSRVTATTYKKHKIVVQNIQVRSKAMGLSVIQLLGQLIFLAILSLSLMNYEILRTEYVSQSNEILNLDWPQQVRNSLQQMVIDLNMVDMIKTASSQSDYLQPALYGTYNVTAFSEFMVAQNQKQYKILLGYIMKHLRVTYQSQEIEEEIMNKKIQFEFFQQKEITGTSKKYIAEFHRLEYAVYFLFSSAFYVTRRKNIGVNDEQLRANFEIVALAYDDVNAAMEQSIRMKFDQLNSNALTSCYIILSFAIVFLYFMIHIYAYVQNQRSKVLSLACTFTTSSLKLMLDSTQKNYEMISRQSHMIRIRVDKKAAESKANRLLRMNSFRNPNNKPKKSFGIVSNTRKRTQEIIEFKRFNFLVSMFAVVCLAAIQTYSLSNVFFVDNLIYLLTSNRAILGSVSDQQTVMNRSVGFTPGLIRLKINNRTSEFNTLFSEANTSVAHYFDMFTDMNSLYAKEESIERHNKTTFMTYLDGVMKGDACQTTEDNKDLVTGGGFSLKDCSGVKNHALSNGIISGIKFYQSIQTSQFAILEESNFDTYLKKQSSLFEYFSLPELNMFRLNLQHIFSAIKKFFRYEVIGEYTRMININENLFISQIIITVTIFILIQYYFFSRLTFALHGTKQVLDVFDIYSLIHNPSLYDFLRRIK